VPANARVEEFVAHSHVLPHAEVVVTHGGMGATQKALTAGVPVVVVPWGRDQAEVGRRAEARGRRCTRRRPTRAARRCRSPTSARRVRARALDDALEATPMPR
jgi:UDP:flavonoid glycosyltransferase YjiC (YdhE family)